MSGYSQDVGGSERAPDAGIALVQKPFTEQALLESVRAVIAAPGRAGGGAAGPSRPRRPAVWRHAGDEPGAGPPGIQPSAVEEPLHHRAGAAGPAAVVLNQVLGGVGRVP